MFDFILTHLADFLIGAIVLTAVILAVRSIARSRKKGTCCGCSYAKSCGHGQNQCHCDSRDLSLEELEEMLKKSSP